MATAYVLDNIVKDACQQKASVELGHESCTYTEEYGSAMAFASELLLMDLMQEDSHLCI